MYILYLQIDVVLHESHARVSWPALLVVVAHNVLIVGIWMFRQLTLDQVTSLLSSEPRKAHAMCEYRIIVTHWNVIKTFSWL